MPITVVFGGRPLREAADESTYNGVVVRYGESPEEVRGKLVKSLASAGRSKAALVTSDADLESEMSGKGFAVMKVSTLRKAMEPAGSEGGGREGGFNGNRDRDRGDRGDRDGGRRNRNRSRGGRRPQGDPAGNNQGESSPRSSENTAPSSNSNDPVKNLIDLVE